MLPQGELAQFHDGEEGMRYIASVELKPGTVRGNHYHEKKREWFYLISGELLLVVQDLESAVREEIHLKSGDLVYISPSVAHAFGVQAPGYGVEFSPVAFDPADTYRTQLIT
jgi:mannose-6-phosphate isomerase-like protein (cupin superfamily)